MGMGLEIYAPYSLDAMRANGKKGHPDDHKKKFLEWRKDYAFETLVSGLSDVGEWENTFDDFARVKVFLYKSDIIKLIKILERWPVNDADFDELSKLEVDYYRQLEQHEKDFLLNGFNEILDWFKGKPLTEFVVFRTAD